MPHIDDEALATALDVLFLPFAARVSLAAILMCSRIRTRIELESQDQVPVRRGVGQCNQPSSECHDSETKASVGDLVAMACLVSHVAYSARRGCFERLIPWPLKSLLMDCLTFGKVWTLVNPIVERCI